MDSRAKAERLRALHHASEPLIVVNVWDAASARTVAAQPGCAALATASWSIAAAHGVDDHEELGRDTMLAAVARIAAATELPVSADLEEGYGATAADVAETMRLAWEAGAVGCNVEDAMRPLDDAVARVRAAVDAGLVVNARTDAFLRRAGGTTDEDVLAEAVRRGQAFLEAGADCVFVPGVTAGETIRALVDALGAVSVFATPGSPPLPELARLGVRRISFGPGPLGVAAAALGAAARALLAGGAYPPELSHRP